MKIDHIHFYVENAKLSSDWFVNRLQFQVVDTNISNHTHTEVLKSGTICFLLSSPLTSASPVTQFLKQHPPGVADVAFQVSNIESVMDLAVAQGTKIWQPLQKNPKNGLKWGKIAAWGGLNHTLIEVGATKKQIFPINSNSLVPFIDIDHLVLNVEVGKLNAAVAWYQQVLGFIPQQIFNIKTEKSALQSQVMIHPDSGIKLPINEPASSNSQIQEFLDFNCGAGIQHIALQTTNIVEKISELRARGLSFLVVPPSYYTKLIQRPGFKISIDELKEIAAQQILVDWQEECSNSLLLQTFTQPIFAQPTFFFEIIERRFQVKGFGEGNFRALFEAMEREQIKRGSLH